MVKLKKHIAATVFFLLLFVQGCLDTHGVNPKTATKVDSFRFETLLPRAMRDEIWSGMPSEKGDPYADGFRDGCDTYSSIMGPGTFRMIPIKINAQRLVSDDWYLRGYQDASEFCTFRLDWETH